MYTWIRCLYTVNLLSNDTHEDNCCRRVCQLLLLLCHLHLPSMEAPAAALAYRSVIQCIDLSLRPVLWSARIGISELLGSFFFVFCEQFPHGRLAFPQAPSQSSLSLNASGCSLSSSSSSESFSPPTPRPFSYTSSSLSTPSSRVPDRLQRIHHHHEHEHHYHHPPLPPPRPNRPQDDEKSKSDDDHDSPNRSRSAPSESTASSTSSRFPSLSPRSVFPTPLRKSPAQNEPLGQDKGNVAIDVYKGVSVINIMLNLTAESKKSF